MLRTAFDFNEAFPGYITAIDLKDTNQICLPQLPGLSDSSDVLTDVKILFDFLFHNNTPQVDLIWSIWVYFMKYP